MQQFSWPLLLQKIGKATEHVDILHASTTSRNSTTLLYLRICRNERYLLPVLPVVRNCTSPPSFALSLEKTSASHKPPNLAFEMSPFHRAAFLESYAI